mmetsp:Transcript_10938/g.44072  ORF Transcript_10938/g.44072 Transcript_10938/m.44072 type:complete len:247 (-) Transcript_10938:588-1328(-)
MLATSRSFFSPFSAAAMSSRLFTSFARSRHFLYASVASPSLLPSTEARVCELPHWSHTLASSSLPSSLAILSACCRCTSAAGLVPISKCAMKTFPCALHLRPRVSPSGGISGFFFSISSSFGSSFTFIAAMASSAPACSSTLSSSIQASTACFGCRILSSAAPARFLAPALMLWFPSFSPAVAALDSSGTAAFRSPTSKSRHPARSSAAPCSCSSLLSDAASMSALNSTRIWSTSPLALLISAAME